jgi:hypothetical protein
VSRALARARIAVVAFAAVTVATIGLALPAAPAPARTPLEAPPQIGTRPVYVIGDSVMLGAQPAVVAALAPIPVNVDAVESRSLLGSVSLLQQHRAEMGDVVVVALGTNDGTDPVEFAHRLDLAMGALQGVPHVLWVNQRQFAPGRDAMNAQLVAATARYPNLRVLDWNATVDTNPADVGPDGIHLTDAGKAAMAALVAGAVREALTPPTTTTTTSTTTTTTPRREGTPVDRAGAHTRAPAGASSSDDFPGVAVAVAAALAVVVAALGFWFARRRRGGAATRPRS